MANSNARIVALIFKLFLLASFTEHVQGVEDKHYWHIVGNSELMDSLKYKWNTNTAKERDHIPRRWLNPETVTATRIYNAGEEGYLVWEKFPHIGLLKTYALDQQAPDSASAATAIFSGVKTNYEVTGVDANVQMSDCEASLEKENQVDSIIDWAQKAGKDTVTHATPSALYVHTSHRGWECEKKLPKSTANCKDTTKQLIEDLPGRDIKVIMGGGRQISQSNSLPKDDDPIRNASCYSQNGRDLMADWAADKARRNFSHVIVQNNMELWKVDPEKTDYIMNVFANGFISLDWKRNKGPEGQPSLEDMTTTAIKILQKSKKGFVLVVEGWRHIDVAHHEGHAAQALEETVRFSETINATLGLVDTNETLIIVTSDHGHGLIMRGTSNRGANILGFARQSKFEMFPYTTLGYATGGPNSMAYEVHNATTVVRKDPSLENTTAFTYSQQASVISDEGRHSGVDVPIYAIAFSAKIGEYYTSDSSLNETAYSLIFLMVLLIFLW